MEVSGGTTAIQPSSRYLFKGELVTKRYEIIMMLLTYSNAYNSPYLLVTSLLLFTTAEILYSIYAVCLSYTEACRLRPSVIEVTHKNSVFMVKKEPPRVARTVYVNTSFVVHNCVYAGLVLVTTRLVRR